MPSGLPQPIARQPNPSPRNPFTTPEVPSAAGTGAAVVFGVRPAERSCRFQRALKMTPDVDGHIYGGAWDKVADAFRTPTGETLQNRNGKPRQFATCGSVNRSIQVFLSSDNPDHREPIDALRWLAQPHASASEEAAYHICRKLLDAEDDGVWVAADVRGVLNKLHRALVEEQDRPSELLVGQIALVDFNEADFVGNGKEASISRRQRVRIAGTAPRWAIRSASINSA